jgi:hypothetical protein
MMKLLFIFLVVLTTSCHCSQPEVVYLQPRPAYEYTFTVDGTDSTLLYSIYTNDGMLIAQDILASQLDSVINADNE